MKKHRILLCFLAIGLLFSCSAALAQESSSYVTTIYNEQNGLPTGEANVIYQTKDHYVWIGSYGGLIRYDGTNFRNYSEEGLLPSSSIRSLAEDSKGRLWVGTNDAGLFLFENDTFTHIEEEDTPVFLCIRGIAEGKDGTIWVASSSGLAKVENGMLQPADAPEIAGQTVYSLGTDSLGRIWASLNGWQCAVIQETKTAGTTNVSIVPSSSIFPNGEQIYSVTSDKNGDIYLGTYQNTVARLSFPSPDPNTEPDIILLDTGDVSIHNTLSISQQGDILVCGQIGFARIDSQGQLLTFGEESGAAALNGAMQDYEGNLWLASSNHGVIKYSLGWFETPNQIASLDGIAINTVAFADDHYYLGLDSGLMVFDRDWQPVKNELTSLLENTRIRHIITDHNGHVWLAAYPPLGIIRYQPESGRINTYSHLAGMDGIKTRTLLERADGTIAAGTDQGVYLLENDQIIRYIGAQDGLTNTTILCFGEDKNGVLYIGTDGGGMYTLDGDTLTPHGTDEGLAEGVVLRLLPDEKGGLFVSAGSSLYYYKENAFRKLTQFDKAPGSIFDFHLVNDSLYLLQNSGVLEVNPDKLLAGEKSETVLYSFQHGLTGSLNANTWNYLSDDGMLYLATRSGISAFSFRDIETPLPSGIIHSVLVDGTLYEHPASLTLPSDTSRITIHFSSLSFADTDDSRIGYYLEGVDAGEILLTDQKSGSISYTNLPGGDYTFHLRIFHPENPAESHEYTLTLHKEKKLTEQPLFWVVLGIVVIGVLTAVIVTISQIRHRTKMRRMQERQKELQAILVQSLQSFARIIDAKDPYTNGHSVRVAQYARELAKRMHMPEEEQERIYYIALLHDIGKIGIPDHILNKKGPLTAEERAVIQTHPDVGGRVLGDFSALDGIADGARYHHERYDGNGYCEQKKGTDIPLVARIIGVADSYDAMSSDRCYRPALSREKIISELKEHSGTQFDPQIVPYMLAMIEENVVPAKEDAIDPFPFSS